MGPTIWIPIVPVSRLGRLTTMHHRVQAKCNVVHSKFFLSLEPYRDGTMGSIWHFLRGLWHFLLWHDEMHATIACKPILADTLSMTCSMVASFSLSLLITPCRLHIDSCNCCALDDYILLSSQLHFFPWQACNVSALHCARVSTDVTCCFCAELQGSRSWS